MSENTKSANLVWEGKGLAFRAIGGSGYQIRFDNPAGPNGVSPMELVALASGGCTASDVISILQKKQQQVAPDVLPVHEKASPGEKGGGDREPAG